MRGRVVWDVVVLGRTVMAGRIITRLMTSVTLLGTIGRWLGNAFAEAAS